MRFRNLSFIGILYFTLVSIVSVGSASSESFCIEIHKHTSTGILNIDTGDYTEQDGLRTAWYISPDDQYALRLASTDDSSEIIVRSTSTNQVLMRVTDIAPPIDLQEGLWSSESHKIAFFSSYYANGVPAESRVIIVDIPKGTLKTHSFDNLSISSSPRNWSADANYLNLTLSNNSDDHVSYFLASDGEETIPFPVVWSDILTQKWSPDRHRMTLVYDTGDQQKLLLVEPEHGIIRSIDLPVSVANPSIVYSPDGNYLAIYGNFDHNQNGYNNDSGSVLFTSEGTLSQIIPGSVYGVPNWQALWSGNDNVWLSLQPAQSQPSLVLSDAWEYKDLMAYHLIEGRSEVVQANVIVPNYLAGITGMSGGYSGVHSAYLSPDGNRIFIVYEDQGAINVALVDAEGQNRQMVVESAYELALYNGLTSYSTCTACLTTIISLSNPTWIGNHLLIKWHTNQDTRLTWINSDGSGRHELRDATTIENITNLLANQYILYTDKNTKSINLIDLDTGEITSIYQLPLGTELPPWYVVVSQDYQWIILHVGREISKQYLIAMSDFKINEIGPGAAFVAGPTWSPNSQYIAFLKSNLNNISVEIVSLLTEQTQTFAVGQSDFWLPREFVSHGEVMNWVICP